MVFKSSKTGSEHNMNEQIFWELIEQSWNVAKGDLEMQFETIVSKLSQYSPEEILEFDAIFGRYYVKSYTSELWAAAYIINDGCSDDGFDYFRAWLISKGKKIYEDALKNPESLVDVIKIDEAGEVEFGDFLYVANKAYELKSGKEDFYDNVKIISYPPLDLSWSEDENELEKMFPKLVKKFW